MAATKSVKRKLPPITPGDILLEEFLKPNGMTYQALAVHIKVDARCILNVMERKAAIDPALAVRLGHYWGNSPEFWLNLQHNYNLSTLSRLRGSPLLTKFKPRETHNVQPT
jgi:addiction module HigA family antidote